MGEKEPLNDNSITHSICKHCEETNFLDMKLNWQCNYCPEKFPNFKLLLEHYESKHKQDLKRFQIRHIKTKASGIVSATNSEEACEFFGWNSQDCKIKVIE
jgi:hypothetical protein